MARLARVAVAITASTSPTAAIAVHASLCTMTTGALTAPGFKNTRRMTHILAATVLIFLINLTTAQAAETTDDAILLREAEGYGSCCNFAQMNRLCDKVIVSSSPLSARAHWVKAVSYLQFSLYYHRELAELFVPELQEVQRLQPELMNEELDILQIALLYNGSKAFSSTQEVNGILYATLGEVTEPAIQHLIDRSNDSRELICIGWSLFEASSQISKLSGNNYPTTITQLARLAGAKSVQLAPNNYEQSCLYQRILELAQGNDAAREEARRMLKVVAAPPLFATFHGFESLVDNETSTTSNLDPYTFISHAFAIIPSAKSVEEKISCITAVEEVFARKSQLVNLEKLMARAVLLHKKARIYIEADRYSEAIAALTDLRSFAPDYAMSHLYYGLALRGLARNTSNTKEAARLYDEAHTEFLEQLLFNYLDEGVAATREVLADSRK